MPATSEVFNNINRWFEHAAKREQKLIFFGAPILIIVIGTLRFIEPAWLALQDIDAQIQQVSRTTADNQSGIEAITRQLADDPNQKIVQSIQQMQTRLDELDEVFAFELDQLVQPEYMPILLEQTIEQAKRFKLLSLNSIAPKRVFFQEGQQNEAAQLSLYKHGIRLVFSASYFDTRDFLLAMEDLGWRLYWQELEYRVAEYPHADVALEIYTLSTSEEFISVR